WSVAQLINRHLTTIDRSKKVSLDFSKGQKIAHFKNLDAYVAKHLIYPEMAKKLNIEGIVTLQVEISPKGKITDSKIVDALGYGCDEAALELVKKMPLWTPASNYGVPVKTNRLLQFNFSLK
ncbi:MAG: energy transducer TonB, partial [Bacteroidota bacterium]